MDIKNRTLRANYLKKKFQNLFNNRIKVLKIIILIAIFVLIGRLVQLQVVYAGYLKNRAEKTRTQSYIHSYRGEIVDRNGIVLANDITLYDVYIHPRYYKKPEKDHPEIVAQQLSPFLKQSADEVLKKITQQGIKTIALAKKVDESVADKIKELKINGIDVQKRNERKYPQGLLASHILGYMNTDSGISTGVEYTGKKIVDAYAHMPKIQVNGIGDVIYDKDTDVKMVTAPPVGETLQLTIDAKLQYLCESELTKMIKSRNAERGAVVMMDPNTGELLAFAVYPSYDPNTFKTADPNVVKNWAITDVYPPGSTFKIFTVTSGIETGAINEHTLIHDTGQMQVQGWTITNYDYSKRGAPGDINLRSLLEHSSNIGSAKIALMMEPSKHRDMLEKFGIGSKTGIDLPAESSGIIKPLKEWDPVTRATIGFGYGIATTPIQMASAVSAIANGGTWITPHVIKYSAADAAVKIKKRRILSFETTKIITNILKDSISASKAEAGKVAGYYVAGKTGTSRKPNPKGSGYITGAVFTSFAGYFPADNPRVLIMVVVDNPKGAEVWGSTVAGPVFNAIAAETARYLNIPKDKPNEDKIDVTH